MGNIRTYCLLFLFYLVAFSSYAQNNLDKFIHPGGLHSIADLARMRDKVVEESHPWIDDWNLLIQDPLAQNTYQPIPLANLGANRGIAAKDAHAAYLNTIRWYISGDESYADCAMNILNKWSSTVNQIPTGGEIWGLGGISISSFAMAAEVLRIYDGWKKEDLEQFKSMMLTYMYPLCHNFLIDHHNMCIDYFWANWDANNILALVSIGVLCDNREIFNEGIEYYKYGNGAGSIQNAVYYIHENGFGQWQESGRDQEHAQLGIGLLGTVCQVAWNQGIDLYAYDNNRLLAGAEYVAKYNQNQEVPFKFYNNCQPSNNKWPAINGRGRLDDRPLWEMLYNHYVVLQGLEAPYTQKMAELMRPEHGSFDHFGYGTLTFTLEGNRSPYPPFPAPIKPTNVQAIAGIEKVFLSWDSPANYTASGYKIQRSKNKDGKFITIASWNDNTNTSFIDKDVDSRSVYCYRIAGINQSGTGEYSNTTKGIKLSAPSVLPEEWQIATIGNSKEKQAEFAKVSGSTITISGSGTQIGGSNDEAVFCYKTIDDNFELTCRISQIDGALRKAGIMIRTSLSPSSPCATITLGEAGNRFARMGYRQEESTEMKSTLGNTYTWIPAWFKITKNGNHLAAFESSDGNNWFKINSINLDISESCYAGFVITSKQNKSTTTTFDNIKINHQ